MNTLKVTDEVKVADSSDWRLFDQIDKAFAKAFKTKSLAVCDGLDEAYYDHDVDGTVVTVHLQHYLGVRIFLRYPDRATEKDLTVLRKIRDHYQNAEQKKM
ncbi:MAG: hypothetical protein H0X66_16000 [Verrucomicrobia bacterium]|nr:hypothetical protein [Verrucomicrobiota bacterium]